jgi:hypothetical protein
MPQQTPQAGEERAQAIAGAAQAATIDKSHFES